MLLQTVWYNYFRAHTAIGPLPKGSQFHCECDKHGAETSWQRQPAWTDISPGIVRTSGRISSYALTSLLAHTRLIAQSPPCQGTSGQLADSHFLGYKLLKQRWGHRLCPWQHTVDVNNSKLTVDDLFPMKRSGGTCHQICGLQTTGTRQSVASWHPAIIQTNFIGTSFKDQDPQI